MDVFVLGVVSAFLLFTVLLPFLGIVLGLFCYYVLPYFFGGLVSLALLVAAGVKILFFWWVWLVAVLWASAVFFVKMKYRKLGEEVEHHHAAHATLLFGAPYRRKRNQLLEAFAGEAEV